MSTDVRLLDLVNLFEGFEFYIDLANLLEDEVLSVELGLSLVIAPHSVAFALSKESSNWRVMRDLLCNKMHLIVHIFEGFS